MTILKPPNWFNLPLAQKMLVRCGDHLMAGRGSVEPPVPPFIPLSPDSPWRMLIPASPDLHASSAAIVTKLVSWNSGQPMPFAAGVDGTADDFNVPLYYASAGDGSVTLSLGALDEREIQISGTSIKIPAAAVPAGGSDAHLLVVDESEGWVYDFYDIASIAAGTLTAAAGGRSRFSGDGFGNANSNAAKTSGIAGRITTEEWIAAALGQIEDFGHAIAIMVKSTDGTNIWPASGNAGATDATDAPPCGAWFQATWTDEEIDALSIPAVAKAFVRTACRYGMIVMDTTGGSGSWNVRSLGNDTADNAILSTRPLLAHVVSEGEGGNWFADTGDIHYFNGVHSLDWTNHLRVLSPTYMRGLYETAIAYKKLDPSTTVTDGWSETGGANTAACLIETTYAPFAGDATLRIGTQTDALTAETLVDELVIPEGKALKAITLWTYGNTSANVTWAMSIVSGTTVLASYTPAKNQTYCWRAVTYVTDGSDLDLDNLRIRLVSSSTGAGFANVRAAHIMAEFVDVA